MVRCNLKDERGQGLVEYGLIVALIAVLVILVMGNFKDGVDGAFDNLITDIQSILGSAE
ncbi:MAG: Flp family type IVb pilin [Peptoclostridium sp.]|nr:Flp family type IVb pilin [Peptoclostridium sp.]